MPLTHHGERLTSAPSLRSILAELRREARPGVLRGTLPRRPGLTVPASSMLPWVLFGVGALGLGFLFGAWLVKRKKAPTRVGAYEALAGVGFDGLYLSGTDALST